MQRTPEQTKAIESIGQDLCVDAGAGSGKTSVLVGRVLHILGHRLATLDQIVAITFTEKAAAEMKARLRREFHLRAPVDDPQSMSFWRDLERRADSARFSTIHSFCASLLRANALALHADPDFRVLTDAEALLLRENTLDTTLHALLDAGDEATVRAAAEYGMRKLREHLRRLLKNRALMAHINRDHPLHDPDALATHWNGLIQIQRKRWLLALSRSRKLRELRGRLASFDGRCADAHEPREALRRDQLAALDRILANGELSSVKRNLEYLANATARRPRKKAWDSEATFDALKKVQDELKKFAGERVPTAVDADTERAAAGLTCDLHHIYLHVVEAYQDAKAAQTSRDFDDLIDDAATMIQEHAHVRASTARGIKFLLVDEFQDTDKRQLHIAELLSAEPDGPELFIVGDAKQSIYRFRGAEVDVFAQARNTMRATIGLTHNFRSLPNLIEFVNDFFARSEALDAVEHPYHPLKAHRDTADGHRVEFLLPAPENEISADEGRALEASLIASRLIQMCTGVEAETVLDVSTGETRPAHFGDVALLFRSLSSVDLYERVLRDRGIPYTVIAGAGFYERQEVLDLRNLLALLVDPWNEMALLAYLRSPIIGLSDDSLAHLCERDTLTGAFHGSYIPEGFSQPREWDHARVLLERLRAHRERSLPDLLRLLLQETGYEAIVLSQFLGVQKTLNLQKVVRLAEDFAARRAGGVAAFVQYLDEITAESELREGDATLHTNETGSVTLMTVHKSKGLEFPIVVVPDLARSAPPRPSLTHPTLGIAVGVTGPDGETEYPAIYNLIHRDDHKQDMAENARILYVAMTRARDWLLLSGAPSPRRSRDTWLAALDDVYRLNTRADGEEIRGDGWSAVVRHQLAPLTVSASEKTSRPVPTREQLLRQVALAPASPPKRATFSVSEILDALVGIGDTAEPPVDEFGAAHLGATEAMLRGTLVHRMLELWNFTTQSLPDIERILRRECPALDRRDPMLRSLREVAHRLTTSDLWPRISAGPDCSREFPFVLRIDDALINGTIDLLLADGSIVDYKTGAPHAELNVRYERQLQLYAAARLQLTQTPPPSAFIYYVDSALLKPVDISGEQLVSCLAGARTAIQRLRAETG